MEYHFTTSMLFSQACLIYIVSGLICGVVRFVHMCRPYDQMEHFYYPARRQVAFAFAMVAMQLPYVLNPVGAGVMNYVRVFSVLYYPMCFTILYKRYFRDERMKLHTWNSLGFVVPFAVLAIMLLVIAIGEGSVFDRYATVLLGVAGVLGVWQIAEYVKVTMWLRRKVDKFHQDNFSNEEDFPYQFAGKVCYMPLTWIVLMWSVFFTGNAWVKLVVDLLCAVWMVVFLIFILHPQKAFNSPATQEAIDKLQATSEEKMEEVFESEKESEVCEEQQPDVVSDEVRQAVLQIIGAKFREPHLLKPDVLANFSHGQKMEANRFIMQVGYYNLVNMCRLEYARQYKNLHPNATQDEVASEAGFSSRYTLYNARRSVTIDRELVKFVKVDEKPH